jgi:hypothetical protein
VRQTLKDSFAPKLDIDIITPYFQEIQIDKEPTLNYWLAGYFCLAKAFEQINLITSDHPYYQVISQSIDLLNTIENKTVEQICAIGRLMQQLARNFGITIQEKTPHTPLQKTLLVKNIKALSRKKIITQ